MAKGLPGNVRPKVSPHKIGDENFLVRFLSLVVQFDRLIPISYLRFFSRGFYLLFKGYILRQNRTGEHIDSLRITEDKYLMVRSMLKSALRARWARKSFNTFLRAVFLNSAFKRIKIEWRKEKGYGPPAFLVISPTNLCNLKCSKCYANAALKSDKLSYPIFSRIIKEAKELWGARFFVISGGEPFMYRDGEKGIFDIFQENRDALFLVYTNGLLINDKVAQRLQNLGNVTPAISVEGFKELTDKRRGTGIFEEICEVMRRLKKHKVIFGISLTATRENVFEILSDQFIDFFFKELGASYGWLFHYMPIGRDIDHNLTLTPKQRVWMWQKTWQIVKEQGVVLADFWNMATVSDGCIAGGREGGYFHINWHGDVAPCVFFPYTTVNIKEIYKNGGTLNDALNSPLLQSVRNWQQAYGYLAHSNGANRNWLRPCPIRDHFVEAREIIRQHNAQPLDYASFDAIDDLEYCQKMNEFDEGLRELTEPIWNEVYLKK